MPDLYDTGYADDVAGHVEAGSFITDDAVKTTEGFDEFFHGESRPAEKSRRVENVGTEQVNKAIGRAVDKAEEYYKPRKPVSVTATDWRTGNLALQDGNATRLVIANPNRKDVVVTNQSAAVMSIGKESGIRVGGPNTVYLPAGSARTFEHTREIWIVGAAGQIVDFVETNYV